MTTPAARRTLDQSLLDFVIGSLHNYSPEAGGADFYLGDYTSPDICYAALDDYFAHMARLAPRPSMTVWATSSTPCGICVCGMARASRWTAIWTPSGRS